MMSLVLVCPNKLCLVNIGPVRQRQKLIYIRCFFIRRNLIIIIEKAIEFLIWISLFEVSLKLLNLFFQLSIFPHELVELFHELLVSFSHCLDLFQLFFMLVIVFLYKCQLKFLVRILFSELFIFLSLEIYQLSEGLDLLSQ